jgi:hypothetical protein
MLSAFTTSFHRDVLKDQTLENQIRNRWTLSEGAVIAFSRGVIRLEQLEGTEVQISFFLGRNPLTLRSAISSTAIMAAKLP